MHNDEVASLVGVSTDPPVMALDRFMGLNRLDTETSAWSVGVLLE